MYELLCIKKEVNLGQNGKKIFSYHLGTPKSQLVPIPVYSTVMSANIISELDNSDIFCYCL